MVNVQEAEIGYCPSHGTYYSLIARGKLKSPINLRFMKLDCGRKPEQPEKTWGEQANSTQNSPKIDSNP